MSLFNQLGGWSFDIEITVLLSRAFLFEALKRIRSRKTCEASVALREGRPFALHNSLLQRDKSQLKVDCFLLFPSHGEPTYQGAPAGDAAELLARAESQRFLFLERNSGLTHSFYVSQL